MESFHVSLLCDSLLSFTFSLDTQYSRCEDFFKKKNSLPSVYQSHPSNSLLSIISGIYLTSAIFSQGGGEDAAALNVLF
jgi:hypothetical protein